MNAPGVSDATTWNGAAGAPVPTPMSVPVWNTTESPRSVAVVNTASRPGVPAVTSGSMVDDAALRVPFAPAVGSLASTNAEAGLPPTVSASAAFSAYGTATSITRGRSRPATETCSHRACSARKISSGARHWHETRGERGRRRVLRDDDRRSADQPDDGRER